MNVKHGLAQFSLKLSAFPFILLVMLNSLPVQQVYSYSTALGIPFLLSSSLYALCFFLGSEREAKELFISSGALESLQSSDDASDVVVRILDKMQLSQEALTNPAPETTRIIRSLARMAKRENRSEVAKHLRKITSPGTAGILLFCFANCFFVIQF